MTQGSCERGVVVARERGPILLLFLRFPGPRAAGAASSAGGGAFYKGVWAWLWLLARLGLVWAGLVWFGLVWAGLGWFGLVWVGLG